MREVISTTVGLNAVLNLLIRFINLATSQRTYLVGLA